LVVLACTGNDGTTAAEGGGDAGDDSTGASSDGGSDSAATCSASVLMPGDETVTIEFGGLERTYELHVPPSYDGSTAVPLLLNFHGFLGWGAEQRDDTAMVEKADQEGFIAVHPDGVGTSWNGGDCCGEAALGGIDDVGLARAIVEEVSSRACIDRRRVYAAGFSNGGFLSHRLACEAADVFAAIMPVSGVMGIPDAECKPVRPIPVMHVHGTADDTILYEGGGIAGNRSVQETIDGWIARNGCTGSPQTTYQMGDTECETVGDCDGGVDVTLCTIEGGQHVWPGGTGFVGGGGDIDATDAAWQFFRDITLPQ
jgi:polyhydroxybutyrate depolymerase